LVLGYTSANLMNIMKKYDVSQAILSNSHGESIVKFCKQNNIKVKVHFKMDTGMNRIGFLCKSSEEQNVSAAFVKDLCQRPQLIPEGIFTHFSSSDDIDDFAYTQIQFKNFMHTVEKLELLGVRFTLKHCCNSAAVINYPQMQLDMVRTGIMLYGLKPARRLLRNIDLVPAMSLKTVVSQIKCIPKKSSISYCRKYVSGEKMTVATVPIGYADGYSRSFSNRASMLVGGKRAKILGNICMDQLVLDISDIKNVREGDIVTVFGADGEDVITVDELATYIDTINYEIICSVGKRVSRMYFSGAKLIAQINYIDTANGDKCCAK
jgi:alanine racemase